MSGYPNQPPTHQGIYPQFYNPVNGPSPQQYPAPGYPAPGQPAPGYQAPGQPAPGYHAPGQPAPGYGQPNYSAPGQPAPGFGQPGQYPYQPGFAYGQPGQPPAAMSYPTPVVSTQYGNAVEWIPISPKDALSLGDRAVVAGYEGYDGSPLWVIRANFKGDLIPGKLCVKHQVAYVAWDGKENTVRNIEVCCARPEKVRWQESRDGVIPPNAVVGGKTASGEPLYVGRAREQGSLTPGKVHPSHRVLYISFAGKEVPHKTYEILCQI